MFRNFKMVSKVIFGRGCFNQLTDILSARQGKEASFTAFIVDHAFENQPLRNRIPAGDRDMIIWADTTDEPKTAYVDELTARVRSRASRLPDAVVGIGGGSVMDLAKAVSLMLTNPGSAADYQGWDLIKNPAVFHAGIPTLSGTGAEVSRTTVPHGPRQKAGHQFRPYRLRPDRPGPGASGRRADGSVVLYGHGLLHPLRGIPHGHLSQCLQPGLWRKGHGSLPGGFFSGIRPIGMTG